MRNKGEIRQTPSNHRRARHAAWIIAIVIVSVATGMICAWLAPGVDRYARDLLMRERGPLPPPDDIVIVAIDESSIARLGRFPWQRTQTARAVDLIAAAQPKVIALDVLYSEPTNDADDAALANSIARSGNTIVAAQLVEATNPQGERSAAWLRPIPHIEQAAAGVGHIDIATEADGAARELPLRKADDQGQSLWSIAVETVRVGDRLRNGDVQDVRGGVRLGSRFLPIAVDENRTARLATQGSAGQLLQLRADPMLIDYVGPAGSFASHTYSFADVLDGKVSAEKFRGKYVLIGAIAATLGDHVASPFVHSDDASGNQHGTLMPGVEVLANAVNTILSGRFYRETPDWLVLLIAALVAFTVFITLTLAQGRFEALKQLGVLGALVALILIASYFVFSRWLIFPPVVPSLISLAVAAPLTLLKRSLTTSADLDERIAELSLTEKSFAPSAVEQTKDEGLSSPATLIAKLTDAEGVSILARQSVDKDSYKTIASKGVSASIPLSKEELLRAAPLSEIGFRFGTTVQNEGDESTNSRDLSPNSGARHVDQLRTLTLRLGDPADPLGALVITHRAKREPDRKVLRLCVELATSYVRRIMTSKFERALSTSDDGWRLPRGVEWKARALAVLQRRMMARARFVDRALRSVEDGLIVADVDGRIVFSNPRAADVFGASERVLIGSNLFQRIAGDEISHSDPEFAARVTRDLLLRLVVERLPVEREIIIGDAPPRYYTLRLSAVTEGDDGDVLGLVASLSDITKQHELQETKNDVMALVTHELRTPLTAIQGMSEVLAAHELNPKRQRDMHLAINEEAKRLARLINDYLDITRLESDARPLRLTATRLAPLVERALLMLEPLAVEREMRISRRFAPNLPAVLVDADLLAQVMTNLVANAIKYSNPPNEVVVELRADTDAVWIEVMDHGHGIPAEAIPRVFEKFYRVPRVEDADVVGNGLGLAFVREIVEKHGGRITVESKVGIGSAFLVRLPLSPKDD